ncbi:MAG: hypothetical protein ACRERD_05150 [Candidatus Binatia bacterium]
MFTAEYVKGAAATLYVPAAMLMVSAWPFPSAVVSAAWSSAAVVTLKVAAKLTAAGKSK